MIITLSPAKLFNFKSLICIEQSSQPLFADQAIELINILQNMSVDRISSLMNIKGKQVHDVYNYIQSFNSPKTPQRQAVFAYNGIAYQGFDAQSADKSTLAFAQEHLVILSGLYGALRPLDMIKPYRLELQSPLENPKGRTLYNYWSDSMSNYMADRMHKDDNIWINLSSNEYTKAINRRLLPKGHRVITPLFKEHDGERYRQVIVYAKKARGMMARFIAENELTDMEHIKAFDSEGYYFSPNLSSKDEWVFIR